MSLSAGVVLRSEVELAASVPYLVGFFPIDSLVMVCLDADGVRSQFVARVDLDFPLDRVGEFMQGMRRVSTGEFKAFPVLFESVPRAGDALMREVLRVFSGAGIRCEQPLTVRDGLVFGGRLPVQGVPLSSGEGVGAFFALQGLSPLTSREDLVSHFVPLACSDEVLTWLTDCSDEVVLADVVEAWRLVCSPEEGPVASLPVEVIGAAAWGVTKSRDVRDAVAAMVVPGSFRLDLFDEGTREALLPVAQAVLAAEPGAVSDRLMTLCARIPAPLNVPVLTIAAHAFWHEGKGGHANVALEQVFKIEPDYPMAVLLERLIATGVRLSGARA